MPPRPSRFAPEPSRLIRLWLAVLLMAFLACALPGIGSQIVISQVYGGGGNSGAAYRNDFVELFNRGSNTVSLAGWSIQYSSAAGTAWRSTPLSGALEPGRYFLLQLASGGVNGELLPTPDLTGTLILSASAGKVALLNSTSLLGGACPSSGEIVDLIGYGKTATCFEGSDSAPSGANALAVFRASGGCVDSDDNAADFFTTAPAPRNRNSPASGCSSMPSAVALHVIQGGGTVSPLAGQLITTTTNIVTGIRNNGFFLQAPDAGVDEAPATSEAVFVFTPDGLPSAAATIGNAVVVAGIVEEFRPASDPAVPARTQLIHAVVALVAIGQPLPAPLPLSASERYSFSFDGNAQALDHIVANVRAHARLTRYACARLNADFPESFRSNFNRPERLSDHDAPIGWFALTKPPRFTSITLRVPGEVELRWCAEPGQTNHIEASSDLKDWTAIATVSAGFDGLAVFSETNAPLSSIRSYRVTVPQPVRASSEPFASPAGAPGSFTSTNCLIGFLIDGPQLS